MNTGYFIDVVLAVTHKGINELNKLPERYVDTGGGGGGREGGGSKLRVIVIPILTKTKSQPSKDWLPASNSTLSH